MRLKNEGTENQALDQHQWREEGEPAPGSYDVFQNEVVKIRAAEPEESSDSFENTPMLLRMKHSLSQLLKEKQSSLDKRITRRSTVVNIHAIGRKSTVRMTELHSSLSLRKGPSAEPEYIQVELPRKKVILSAVWEKVEEKIDELRVKKEFELKMIAAEKKNKQQYQDAMANKKGAQEVTKVLQSIRGFKDSDNIFSFLQEKGQAMTFDNSGLPMMQKSVKNSNSLIERVNFSVNEDVLVTKAKGKMKGKNVLKRSESIDDGKFDGRIQGVIENKYGKPSNNMVIQAGVRIVEKDKIVQGPHVELKNRISLIDYQKLVDPKAQHAKQMAQQAQLKKNKTKKEYESNPNEDPYQEFKKFAQFEANRMSTRKSTSYEDSTRQSQDRSVITIKEQLRKGEKHSPAIKPHNHTEFNRFLLDVNAHSHKNLKPYSSEYNVSKLNSAHTHTDTNSTIESCYPTTTLSRNKQTISLSNMHTSASKDKVQIFRNDEERNQSMRELNLMKSAYQKQPPKISDLRPPSYKHSGSVRIRQRSLKQ